MGRIALYMQTLLASVCPQLQDHSLRKTALKARDSSLERLFALVLALFHDLGGSLSTILRPEGEHADAGNNAGDPNGEANLQPEMVQELRVLLVEDSTDDRGQKNKKSGVDGDEDGLRIQLKSAVDELSCTAAGATVMMIHGANSWDVPEFRSSTPTAFKLMFAMHPAAPARTAGNTTS
eukprot:CAMPEP_0177163376 /NCGR_PEP_ID=MMETSP0367-20130122/6384_1 /TAXON_ID=447022 ORGANISM="Scrippsiella hangoei-like, Strain SHHI-4" /NCGR_SAMPLE_ID=MMETSP0367 /ASSEMBLY_ACC=CAM_ASM_000362 /LENGTH=178 /DNA_ID=CAMNT_0018609207 /DNA_START=119 /DNA_END=652 /DNA_ORIENTATION=+